MPIIQQPKALGLMLCDQVVFEHGTQKPSLIGVFTGVAATGFPSIPQQFDVFAAVTDGLGQGDVDLVVVRLETEEQIAAQSVECAFQDPLQVINFRFRFRQLSFPAAGDYVFVLLADGEEVAHRRAHVYQIEELP